MTDAEDLARAWLEQLESQRDAVTRTMETVFNAHHGESVSKVLMALWNEFDEAGILVTTEWLLPYARMISSGQRPMSDQGRPKDEGGRDE